MASYYSRNHNTPFSAMTMHSNHHYSTSLRVARSNNNKTEKRTFPTTKLLGSNPDRTCTIPHIQRTNQKIHHKHADEVPKTECNLPATQIVPTIAAKQDNQTIHQVITVHHKIEQWQLLYPHRLVDAPQTFSNL